MARDYERIREMEWDSVSIGANPHAHICPMCAALVPIANQPFLGHSYREAHIRWHEGKGW